MKYLFFYGLFFFSVVSYSQTKEDWDKLLDSPHNIGYCLYNVNQQFCNEHIATQNRIISEASEDEPEIHYFVMEEKWARERVTEWAERVTHWENNTRLNKADLLLLFDINQYYIHFDLLRQIKSESSFFGHSSFFVVNLEDDLKFKINKGYKNLALNCSIYHDSEPNMLYNIMWREFMSGRLGLLENEVEFGIASDFKIRKKFRRFKRCFYRFKKQNFRLK
ncbi:hypothetical protein [uncultured Winogradskyella sp.]|uniref:hypothetical protein n=1 Tax=uncultured Winogradskyella sp. TaxID=395353 RepID=UPI002621801D|nr:hypothetical protein [uncultured Winogradskyella sp.]